ncbi:restriction endonuclease subunit S [Limosilactobacillus reuteri]|uniref:restriction endonuclease subunit S n=2 Tax=Limosilactobacillus reuteri TaxID=1598 RepID=UPI0038571A7F
MGDFGNVQMNKRIFKSQTLDSGDVPFYKIGTFGKKADAYISSELYEEYRNKYPYPKDGDLLISASGSIGKIVEYKGQRAYYQDSNIVWLDHDNRILNLFLKAFFQIVKWNGTEGSTIKRLYNKNILNTEIILPKIKEQTAVGKLIEKFDYLITLQQRKLEQLKQLKKAMLQQLFVNKNNKQPILKFKNFRNNWREYKLSEIVNLEDNKRKPVKATERIRGKIPYYGANGIQDYVKGYTHIGKHVLIAEDGANSVDDYPIYFIYSPSWINNHTHVLTAKEEILSSEFLAYALKKINYAKYLVGSGRYKLNAEILKLIPLKIPTMNEQKYIESNLSKIDKLIILQQNKLTQLTTLKRYLLQKLFI